MTGTIRDMMYDGKGRAILSLTIEGDLRSEYESYKDKRLEISVKEYKAKRSQEANRYMWLICGEIAKLRGIGKDEVYRKAVREVGVFVPVTLEDKAADRFLKEWSKRGSGWFCEVADDSVPGSKDIFAYYGSSAYDTKEMSRLINFIVDDAKSLGIHTESLSEISLLLNN